MLSQDFDLRSQASQSFTQYWYQIPGRFLVKTFSPHFNFTIVAKPLAWQTNSQPSRW
jgi:hypothetical protein